MTGLAIPATSRAATGPLDFAIVGQEWVDEAICAQVDPEIFFPEKGGSTREAKSICSRCNVREQCLQYALDHDERFGIWGGMSERARNRMLNVLQVDPTHLVESVFDTDDDFTQDIGEAS